MQLSFDPAPHREVPRRLIHLSSRRPGTPATISPKRGPITTEDLALRIDHALRNLNNRIELNRNPLLRLTAVQRLAEARYSGYVYPGAVALREIVRRAVSDTVAEIEDDPALLRVRQFLHLYASGSSVKAASEELGLSREHCSRVLKKRAVRLVTEKFARLAQGRRGVIPARLMPGDR